MGGFESFDALDDTEKFIFPLTRHKAFVNSLYGTMLHPFLLNHLLSIKNLAKPSLQKML